MNIFERAARAKLRFATSVGFLTTEDLFDLKLTATANRVSLDSLARSVHNELKDFDAVSFVETAPNPRKIELELQLDIVKHVIESKKAEALANETKQKKAELRRRLTEILAKKEGEKLEGMSVEEIQKELAALEA